jgi:hypothetical protein
MPNPLNASDVSNPLNVDDAFNPAHVDNIASCWDGRVKNSYTGIRRYSSLS